MVLLPNGDWKSNLLIGVHVITPKVMYIMDHFVKLIYYNIITKTKLYTYYFLELKHKTKLSTLAPALFFATV